MSINPPAPDAGSGSGAQDPYAPPPAPQVPVAPAYGDQPAYAAPAPGYAQTPGTPKGSSTLGLVALIASIAAIVIGSILVGIGGYQIGAVAQFIDPVTGNILPGVTENDIAVVAAGGTVMLGVGWLLYGALALWGLIQGIIAAVKNRGRAMGIVAIVLSVIGGIIVVIVMVSAMGAGAAPYVGL